MSRSERQYAFVEFVIGDGAALERLASVTEEFARQKQGEAIREDSHWLPYFLESDLAEFWWPSEAEAERWNSFWFSTPLPLRHSAEMPAPPWHFGSMIDSVIDGEYDLIGVSRLAVPKARLELDPHAYPYGGIDSLRTLVRAFGHAITAFDDGTGVVNGDPLPPRWNGGMSPPTIRKSL